MTRRPDQAGHAGAGGPAGSGKGTGHATGMMRAALVRQHGQPPELGSHPAPRRRQVARLLGAGRVIAACRDSHGRARAANLGADAVADLSGDDLDAITGRLAEATAGRADLVLDPVWGKPAEAAARVLSPHGRLVNLGSSAGPQACLGSATLRSATLSVVGYTNNALSAGQKAPRCARSSPTPQPDGSPRIGRPFRWTGPLRDGPGAGQPPHRRAVLIP